MKIMTEHNPKLMKGKKSGWLNIGLSLAPSDVSGKNVCSHSSAVCRELCLNYTGRGKMQRSQDARIRRTNLFYEDKGTFWSLVRSDIESAEKKNPKTCVRMNVLSDLPWERIKVQGTKKNIMELYPHIQFYDYTKVPNRTQVPVNYHLTFSMSEDNYDTAKEEFVGGKNVAIVFRERPETFWDHPVIDGDEDDLRFNDPYPCIVGLSPKGALRHDERGFVK